MEVGQTNLDPNKNQATKIEKSIRWHQHIIVMREKENL